MLIKNIFLDLNNVGENYNSFHKILPKVLSNVSEKILCNFQILQKRTELGKLIYEYQQIGINKLFHHYPSFWQHVTERVLNRNLSYEEIETVYDYYLAEYKNNIEIFEDYIPLIDTAILKKMHLGLIANGNSKRVYTFLSKYYISDKFSTILPSGSNPFKKPDKDIFKLGLLNLSANPIESVFVGDRKDTDIKGANSTGIWSIHLNRPETKQVIYEDELFAPDFSVSNLSEIWSLPVFNISNIIDSVVIPCGGKGSRMGDVTENNQKCLLSIGGQPLLLRVVNKLKACGINNFYFITKHKGELVHEFFGDGTKHGIKAHYLINNYNSTGAGILSNIHNLPEKFFYSHGNILLSTHALSKVIKAAHLNSDNSIFLITKEAVAKTHPIFNFKNGILTEITRRKPDNHNGHSSFYSIGFSYINKNNIHLSEANDLEEDTTTEQLFKEINTISTMENNTSWLHLETKEDYVMFEHLIDDEQYK
jgi:HAD superfamily hydrolase (TIGR01549 family)